MRPRIVISPPGIPNAYSVMFVNRDWAIVGIRNPKKVPKAAFKATPPTALRTYDPRKLSPPVATVTAMETRAVPACKAAQVLNV